MRHSKTIGHYWRDGGARKNNLDFLRFFAAMAVIFSHSWEITQGSPHFEPIYWLSGGETKLGVLSVLVFFAISGFLITNSWQRNPDLKAFLWRRFLRLFPGLAVAVLFTIFILGPLLTQIGFVDYWQNAQTWIYGINITTFNKWDSLPGLFTNNPLPDVINGSLWTLKFEVMAYLAMALFGVFGLLRMGVVMPALIFCALTAVFLGQGELEELGGLVFYIYKFALLAQAFFAGAVLCLWRNRIPMNNRMAMIAGALIIGGLAIGQLNLMVATAGAYLVFWFAFADFGRMTPIIRQWGKRGDFSYGLYIYGFPVQQAVQALLNPEAPWVNFMVSWPIALFLAFLSWDFIESRALQAKGWISRKTLPERAIVAG